MREESQLHHAAYIDVFTEINIFQVGLIKPENPLSPATEKGCFVPIFPFMYEALDYGESIIDTKHTISLHLQPELDRRVR